jgi:hypothetical protein
LNKVIKNIPGAKSLNKGFQTLKALFKSAKSPFIRFAPPGHFYSPVPGLEEIKAKEATLFNREASDIPGVRMNVETQLELLEHFARYHHDCPYVTGKTGVRYVTPNQYFPGRGFATRDQFFQL